MSVADTTTSQWVWPSETARDGHVAEPRKALTRLLKEAGVETKLSMHDLRRTVGSRLAMSGANAATISAALGHLSPDWRESLRASDDGARSGGD